MTRLAEAQYIRDNRKNTVVCNEILMYGNLKRAWGHGHIKIERVPWRQYDDTDKLRTIYGKKHCLPIYGYDADKYNVRRRQWLGSQSPEQALDKLCEKRNSFPDFILLYEYDRQ